MLCAKRAEATGRARRGRNRGLGPRCVDRLDLGSDQLLADRLLVDLAEEVLDVAIGG